MSRADLDTLWERLAQYRAMHKDWHVGLDREDRALIKAANNEINKAYLRGETAGKNLSEAKYSSPILTVDEPDGNTGVYFVSWGAGKTPYTTYTGLSLNLPKPVNTEETTTQDYYLARAAIRNAILRFQEYKTVDPSIFFETLKDSKDLYEATNNFEYLIRGMIRKAQDPLRQQIKDLKAQIEKLNDESRALHQRMINDAVQAVAGTLSKKYGTEPYIHHGSHFNDATVYAKGAKWVKDIPFAGTGYAQFDQKRQQEKTLTEELTASLKRY